MREDARKLAYEEVELLGDMVLFSELRIDPATVPEGLRLYELRHADDNWGEPFEVRDWIVVNFFGSILTSNPIQFCPCGFLLFEHDDFAYTGRVQITIPDYLAEHPPTGKEVMELTVSAPEKWPLLFTGKEDDVCARRCIGHLHGGFGGGTDHCATWRPNLNHPMNTLELRADMERLVNWLRGEYAPLHDFTAMERFCQRYPDAQVTTESGPVYGFSIETGRYQYMLRCLPVRNDCQFYLYCYQKEDKIK